MGWGCTAVVSMVSMVMVSRVDLFMFCTLIFINIMIILHEDFIISNLQ